MPKYKLCKGPVFASSLVGGSGSHPCHLSVMPLVKCISNMNSHEVLLIESHVAIGAIQQTQDEAMVLWVSWHNSWHAAWQTVILRFMETRWKTLALSPPMLN